jgi:hypothetical protein
VAPNDTDRRRFLLATGLTLLALPALWWANQQADSGAPNVATVGIDVGDGQSEAAVGPTNEDQLVEPTVEMAPPTTAPAITAPPTTAPADPSAPVFLDGPSAGAGGGAAEIAVPAAPTIAGITTSASYRSSISPIDTCLTSNIRTGTTVTVVNLNNGHSVTCIATRVYSTDGTGLIMHTDTFSQIADLTDAPIPVEISQ